MRGRGVFLLKTCLAIDIGASSGRHIVGWKENGEIRTEEVYRFPNGVTEQDGHLIWDIEALLADVKKGIDEALNGIISTPGGTSSPTAGKGTPCRAGSTRIRRSVLTAAF